MVKPKKYRYRSSITGHFVRPWVLGSTRRPPSANGSRTTVTYPSEGLGLARDSSGGESDLSPRFLLSCTSWTHATQQTEALAAMSPSPLFEVFGFPPDNMTERAKRHRLNKLCPFNNKVPNCTKDKAENPLGVCSITNGGDPTITCPVRFREDWRIATDAAEFFGFSPGSWTSLQEVRLNDANGRSAGNIDLVIVSHDGHGHVVDFGSVEIQAVYISGNVRRPFEHYIEDPEGRQHMDWTDTQVRADYLSSSRKRLLPQLTFKGGILKPWGKKQAVALHRGFWDTLPKPPAVTQDRADMAWFVYDFEEVPSENRHRLTLVDTVYTEFEPALAKITSPEPGPLDGFVEVLQKRLDREHRNPPDAPALGDAITRED